LDAQIVPVVVADIERKLQDAETADAAASLIAAVLADRFPVTRVSIRVLDAADDALVMAGVWSRAPTAVTTGLSLPVHATSFLDVARAGRSIRSTWDAHGRPPPLLDQVISDEGNLAWVLAPLVRGDQIRGVLAVSTWDEHAFVDEDLPFFDALADSVSEQLLALRPAPAAG
jgi:GAF domain-containing protein